MSSCAFYVTLRSVALRGVALRRLIAYSSNRSLIILNDLLLTNKLWGSKCWGKIRTSINITILGNSKGLCTISVTHIHTHLRSVWNLTGLGLRIYRLRLTSRICNGSLSIRLSISYLRSVWSELVRVDSSGGNKGLSKLLELRDNTTLKLLDLLNLLNWLNLLNLLKLLLLLLLIL